MGPTFWGRLEPGVRLVPPKMFDIAGLVFLNRTAPEYNVSRKIYCCYDTV